MIGEQFAEQWRRLKEEVWRALKQSEEALAERAAKAAAGPEPLWRQSIPDSELLGKYLGRQAGDELDAHHIVGGKLKRAEPARAILDKYQIDINDPANGVLLPGGKGAPKSISPRRHRGSELHSNDGVDAVRDRLKAAIIGVEDWTTARQRVIDALREIGDEIKSGSFP